LLSEIGCCIHTAYNILICLHCHFAWLPKAIKEHLKSHEIWLTDVQEAELGIIVTENGVLPTYDIIAPQANGPPVTNLKIFADGHYCFYCPFGTPARTSFDSHWSRQHKDMGFVAPKHRFTLGALQTFFSPLPERFFRVNPDLENLPLDDTFALYMQQEVPNFEPFPATLPLNEKEVPPFLQLTQWHVHLENYTQDYKLRATLLSLVMLPVRIPHTATGLELLRDLSYDYLVEVRKIAKRSHITVLCMLQEYPLWVYFNLDKTILKIITVPSKMPSIGKLTPIMTH